MRNTLILFILASVCIGCTTNMREQFEQVKVGMEKDDVLGLIDSPQRTQRWKGMDRWTYIFYNENERIEKEVHFGEGKASYVGDVYRPPVSASEQDALNEASNKEIEAVHQAQRDENKKNFGNLNDSSGSDEPVRFVPQFTPVQ